MTAPETLHRTKNQPPDMTVPLEALARLPHFLDIADTFQSEPANSQATQK